MESLADARSKVPTITPEMIGIMQPGSPFLDNQRSEFSLVSSHIKLICAYESQNNQNTVSLTLPTIQTQLLKGVGREKALSNP